MENKKPWIPIISELENMGFKKWHRDCIFYWIGRALVYDPEENNWSIVPLYDKGKVPVRWVNPKNNSDIKKYIDLIS